MAVFNLLACSVSGTIRWVVLLGLRCLDVFDLDVRAEELEALVEIADVVLGAFGGL